ncbi:hypothetical protein D6D01_00011 [Aureobasidium pullulans]|uniref:Conidiation protein 6 n=1 Tax=Aureobasidium pullulans TaxID=5580 RepID=A0A4S9M3T6_AURPU|nr:hypothetical protein D6D01_00011 [Aureobasidium pullulans]
MSRSSSTKHHFQPPPTKITMSNIGNIIGGHKANLSNPNTSEESKQHSLEVIKKETGTEATSGTGATTHDDDGKDPMRVAAGLKAALHNPNVSDEAKEGVKVHLDEVTHTSHADDGKDATRVAAGLKAALHNDNVSDEAKEHVKERLADMQ